ncbi:MAG: DUF4118 domain-containing protein [Alphaproteobacteria bacterium]|nr:MAG: DUF4118 domain-containing protein [Alphaproteobacteria bacterium]
MKISHTVLSRSPTLPLMVQYGSTLFYVTCSTLLAEYMYDGLNVRRVSAVFLASVLLSAARFGIKPGLFAAALAFVCYNLLTVEPRFSFRIDTLEETLNLVIFFAVAMLTGGLAGRVKDEAVQARARAKTMTALFSASRELSALAGEEEVRGHMAKLIADAVQGEAEIIYDGSTWRSQAEGVVLATTNWISRELAGGDVHLGLARWRTAERPSNRDTEDFVSLIVDIGASAILRARASTALARADFRGLSLV